MRRFIIGIDSGSYKDQEVHSLPSTNRRTMKAGGIIQSETQGLRTSVLQVQVLESKGPRSRNSDLGQPEKKDVPVHEEIETIPPSFPFCSIPALNKLHNACLYWWGWFSSLSLLNQMLISSETPSEIWGIS